MCARRERATTGSDNLKIPDAFSKNRGLAKPLQLLPATAALLPYLLEATRAIGEPPCLYPPLGGARLGPRVCVCVCVCPGWLSCHHTYMQCGVVCLHCVIRYAQACACERRVCGKVAARDDPEGRTRGMLARSMVGFWESGRYSQNLAGVVRRR